MIRVKIFITLDVDEDEYPIPADGRVGEELEDGIQEYFYDVEGEILNVLCVPIFIKLFSDTIIKNLDGGDFHENFQMRKGFYDLWTNLAHSGHSATAASF